MTSNTITRRGAIAALAGLSFAAAALAAHDGVEISYLIECDQRQPSGDMSQRTFQGAMVLAQGETRESDIQGQYRVKVALTEGSGIAHVRISVWDNQRRAGDQLVGNATSEVPIGGDAKLTLLTSDNVHYPIVLTAARRSLP